MTHIVIHDDSSNVTHYARFDDVQAAALYLEGLVNEDSKSNARLFALEPVEFAVKSYVRVEIGGAASEAEAVPEIAAPSESSTAEPSAETPAAEVFTDTPIDDTVEYVEAAMATDEAFAPLPEMSEVPDEPAAGEVRRGLFGR